MAAIKDYYEVLGLKRDAGVAEVKRAYRKLARKSHPDLNPGDKAAEERFKELNDAYAVLSDPKKKEQYDRYGAAGFPGAEAWGGGPQFEQEAAFGGLGGFGDIFGDILGTGRRGPEVYRGSDLATGLEITLHEAFAGTKRKMTLMREVACTGCAGTGAKETAQCAACGGSGKVQSSRGFFKMAHQCPECGGAGRKTTVACMQCAGQGRILKRESVNVKIPAGIDRGSTVKLRGKGNDGHGGGPPGDLRIRISLARHKLFERKDDDVYLKLPVTFGEAALGAKIKVPTIDGTAVMSVPEGTQGGQRFKLRGKGFSVLGTKARGDMFVEIQVAVPKGLGDAEREALGLVESAYVESPRKGLA